MKPPIITGSIHSTIEEDARTAAEAPGALGDVVDARALRPATTPSPFGPRPIASATRRTSCQIPSRRVGCRLTTWTSFAARRATAARTSSIEDAPDVAEIPCVTMTSSRAWRQALDLDVVDRGERLSARRVRRRRSPGSWGVDRCARSWAREVPRPPAGGRTRENDPPALRGRRDCRRFRWPREGATRHARSLRLPSGHRSTAKVLACRGPFFMCKFPRLTLLPGRRWGQ